jgi:hypothetical protein
MERVLLAGEYPNLSMIIFDNFLPGIFLRNLSGKVVIHHYDIIKYLFDDIIRRITNCSFVAKANYTHYF